MDAHSTSTSYPVFSILEVGAILENFCEFFQSSPLFQWLDLGAP